MARITKRLGMRGMGDDSMLSDAFGTPITIGAGSTCPSTEQMLGISDPNDPCQASGGNTSNQVPCMSANGVGPLSPGQIYCATGTTTPPATPPTTGLSNSQIALALGGGIVFLFIFLGNGGKS